VYTDGLLFLFGESETASIVAKMILGKDIPAESLTSQFTVTRGSDERSIDLSAFSAFLTERVDWDRVRTACSHISEIGEINLEYLANGVKIWGTDASTEGNKIANLYKNNYAGLASTTHHVEAAVSKCNYCDNGDRSGLKASQYAIATNFLCEINRKTMMEKKEKLDNGELYRTSDDGNAIKARDKVFAKAMLEFVYTHSSLMDKELELEENKVVLKNIHHSISTEANGFEGKRNEQTLGEIRKRIDESADVNAPQLTRMVGFTRTAAMDGKLVFSKLRARSHLPFLEEELRAREITFNSNIGFKKACEMVKQSILDEENKEMSEGKRKKQQKEIKDIKFFTPMYSTLDKWKEAGYVET